MAMPEIGSSCALPANRGSGGPNQIMREATFKDRIYPVFK